MLVHGATTIQGFGAAVFFEATRAVTVVVQAVVIIVEKVRVPSSVERLRQHV